jgi:hypothetical protein
MKIETKARSDDDEKKCEEAKSFMETMMQLKS